MRFPRGTDERRAAYGRSRGRSQQSTARARGTTDSPPCSILEQEDYSARHPWDDGYMSLEMLRRMSFQIASFKL